MSERDFTPLMPGIAGGCRTVVSAVDRPHAATFSIRRGVVLIITPSGELQAGPALARGAATQELAEMLVDCFGRAYRSALTLAEDRARLAESEARSCRHKLEVAEEMAKRKS